MRMSASAVRNRSGFFPQRNLLDPSLSMYCKNCSQPSPPPPPQPELCTTGFDTQQPRRIQQSAPEFSDHRRPGPEASCSALTSLQEALLSRTPPSRQGCPGWPPPPPPHRCPRPPLPQIQEQYSSLLAVPSVFCQAASSYDMFGFKK